MTVEHVEGGALLLEDSIRLGIKSLDGLTVKNAIGFSRLVRI